MIQLRLGLGPWVTLERRHRLATLTPIGFLEEPRTEYFDRLNFQSV